MLAEPLTITLLVTDAFGKLNVPYLIGGSLASALHGTARSTLDVDLVADLQAEQVSQLVESLQREFYIDEQMIRAAVQHKSSFNLIHLSTMFKVDVFITKNRRFDQLQFQRRHLQVVSDEPERKAYFSTAEDITSPSSIGTAWATKYQTGNGGISWGC